MGTRCRCLVVLCMLPLAAQAPERLTYVGIVRDHDGRPLAGAAVTVGGGQPGGGGRTADIVQTTTGDDGRFRAALRPGCEHFAWAARVTAAGTHVTAAQRVTGTPIELSFAADGDLVPMHLRVTGAEAWRERGALRFRVVLDEVGEVVAAGQLDADGRLALPPLPPLAGLVEVHCDDRAVFVEPLGLDRSLRVPPPRRLRARVHLVGSDEPVAGATIELLPCPPHTATPSRWRRIDATRLPLAVTAADGTAELWIASDVDPWSGPTTRALVFVASHPGHRDSISGFAGSAFLDGRMQPEAAPAEPELTFTLRPEDEEKVPLRGRAGALPTSVRIGGFGTVPNEPVRSTRPHWHHLGVDAGQIRRTASTRSWFRGVALELPAMLPPLAPDDPFRRAAVPLPMMLPLRLLHDARGIDLDTIVACRVQVLDASGGPAVGVPVMLLPGASPTYAELSFAVRVPTDRAGRAVLPSRPEPGFVVALGERELAHAAVDLGADPAPVQLRLRPFDRMQVQCVDRTGQPLRDVRFSADHQRWRGEPEGEDRLLPVLMVITPERLAACRTDADGRAELPFLAHALLQQEVRAVHGHLDAKVSLTVSDEVVVIELR